MKELRTDELRTDPLRRMHASTSEPTCLFVLVDDHLPDPLPLLQSLDDPGQGGVVVGVRQLTAGERGYAMQQLAQGGGEVWRTTNVTFPACSDGLHLSFRCRHVSRARYLIPR